jgi:hypothetical protein
VASTGRFASTRPSGVTETLVGSSRSYETWRVTSRVEPSAKLAVTTSCWASDGAAAILDGGKTSSRTSFGAVGRSSVAPALIQRSRAVASGESIANRRPPSWGTSPVGLRTIKLFAGLARSARRPKVSRVSEARSNAGSSPRRLSLKPPLPLMLPWQGPELQPAFANKATTSVR